MTRIGTCLIAATACYFHHQTGPETEQSTYNGNPEGLAENPLVDHSFDIR